MIDFKSIVSKYNEDISGVTSWCDEVYNAQFASYFEDQRTLFTRLRSTRQPITDAELEAILTTIPLQLFSVSEVLNKFRISQAVIKVKTKQKEHEVYSTSQARTIAGRQAEAAEAVLEDGLLYSAYATVIDRVDSEIAFSRELIMGAKKIWDARKRTEEVHPVGEVSVPSDLPDYVPSSHNQTYIK